MAAHIASICIPATCQARVAVEKLVLVPVWRGAGDAFSGREHIPLAWAETVTGVAETGIPDVDYEAAATDSATRSLRILRMRSV
jgi:hypothetical protein